MCRNAGELHLATIERMTARQQRRSWPLEVRSLHRASGQATCCCPAAFSLQPPSSSLNDREDPPCRFPVSTRRRRRYCWAIARIRADNTLVQNTLTAFLVTSSCIGGNFKQTTTRSTSL